jgi:uncharacterized protein (DUF1330 family)
MPQMRIAVAVTLALFVGMGIGAVGIQALHAQAKPPVYMIADNDVTDPDGYATEYIPLAQLTLKAHGGKYLAAGKGIAIDGDPPKGPVVIVQWDSLGQLKGWRNSPEYINARSIGEKYAKFRVYIVEGMTQ